MVSLRQLEAFQAVMIKGTQTHAAESLRLTQPAVSALIDSLEQQLGFQLFERVKGRLVPSKEATYYHEYVSGVLASFSNLGQVARDIRESNAGTLRIASNPNMSLGFLPRLIARFQQDHPKVSVVLQTRSSSKVVEMLGTQQFDIGFAEMPVNDVLIDVEPLRLRCVCVVPHGHPLAAARVIRPQDLKGVPFLSGLREHMTSAQLGDLWRECGVRPIVKVESQLFWTSCVLAQEGAGIALVDPITAMEFDGDGVVVRPFDPGVFLQMGIMFPSSRPKSRQAHKFSQLVRMQLSARLASLEASFGMDAMPLLG